VNKRSCPSYNQISERESMSPTDQLLYDSRIKGTENSENPRIFNEI